MQFGCVLRQNFWEVIGFAGHGSGASRMEQVLIQGDEETILLSRLFEDKLRRRLSISQEASSHQDLTLLTPCSWPSSLQNCQK